MEAVGENRHVEAEQQNADPHHNVANMSRDYLQCIQPGKIMIHSLENQLMLLPPSSRILRRR